MATSIATSIITALRSFNGFVDQIKDPNAQRVVGLSVRGWEDELGRLRIWAANIGAHQTNQSSLDFRLRDASHVRDQITKLLKSLIRRLGDAQDVLFENQDDYVDVDDPDLTLHDDSDEEPLDLKPEMAQMQDSVATIIDRLFQISMLVRRPAQHDLKVGASRDEVAAFGPFDLGHVRDKYPHADETLISRLGLAMTQRRMHLKYRERHAAKLKQGINRINSRTEQWADDEASTMLSETVISKAPACNIDFDESGSNSGASQTSYATTLIEGGDNITIPPPPRDSKDGKAFECPICYHIIQIKSVSMWNKHVFLDLQPYVCLDMDCTTPQKLYATRHEWLEHLKSAHIGSSEAGSQATEVIKCALCGVGSVDQFELMRHNARHLQELALFVLPHSLHEVEEGSHSGRSSADQELLADVSDDDTMIRRSLKSVSATSSLAEMIYDGSRAGSDVVENSLTSSDRERRHHRPSKVPNDDESTLLSSLGAILGDEEARNDSRGSNTADYERAVNASHKALLANARERGRSSDDQISSKNSLTSRLRALLKGDKPLYSTRKNKRED